MNSEKIKSIIKDRHIAELETWLSTQEAADKLGVSRQQAINLARDTRSGVRGVHVGNSEGERGYWIFDPYSVEASPEAVRVAELRKREEMQRLIDRAEGRS